jgi:hypothetical protein
MNRPASESSEKNDPNHVGPIQDVSKELQALLGSGESRTEFAPTHEEDDE